MSGPALEEQFGIPRCRRCYYVLENLPGPRCPECGTVFDLNLPETYTLKPPFVRWKLWLPGLVLALVGGMALYAFTVPFMGFGTAATLVVPASVGAIIGYTCRVRTFLLVVVGLAAICGLFFGLVSANLVGVFCGLLLAGIMVGPLVIGTLAGVALRTVLKKSSFDQRWHLPLIAFLLLPVVVAVVERALYRRPPAETVWTSAVLEATPARAWGAVVFYEDVGGGPPPLFRLGMPRALYTTGSAAAVGDVRTCVYDKGRLSKRVTAIEPARRLAFGVVEQGFERHSMVLLDGAFEFEPVGAESRRTRVTLVTSYRPLLAPRWCWRPLEEFTVHTLHRHVLRRMAEKAQATSEAP